MEFQGQGGFFKLEIEVHGGTYDCNSMNLHEGGSSGDRQECDSISTNKLNTLLTTAESMLQDKHKSISQVCTFIHVHREEQ